ncbi:MAG: porin family protein [Pyrinomonadaceae bacterium]
MNIRKVLQVLLSVITVVIVAGTYAAGQDEREVNVGVKGGVSIPNLVGGGSQEVTRDYKSRFAYNFGAFVEVGLTPRVSIQTGLDYAPQGGRRDGVQPITRPIPGLPALPVGSYYFADFKNTAKLHYLEVPVLVKYTWRRDSGPQFYVNGGPYMGFLVKATQVTRGTSPVYVDKNKTALPFPFPAIPFDADTDVTGNLHRFNAGFTGGGGIKFPSGRNYAFIDVRASYGLTTLQKNTATDGKSRTGNLVVSFGYAFRVKGK